MVYLIALLLIGINFCIFPLFRLDIWHAQGFWTQSVIMLMFVGTFFEKPKRQLVRNPHLGILNLWIGLSVSVVFYQGLVVGKYNTLVFLPYFNFICLMIFYHICSTYLKREHIERILGAIRYVIILTLGLCVLQRLNLGQFFKLYHPVGAWSNNPVIGLIGNGTHLSGFLASCSPIFFLKFNREDKLSLILMLLVMGYTGTTVGDPSISGYIVFLCIVVYLYKRNKLTWIFLLLSAGLGLIFRDKFPKLLFYNNGRFALWKEYYPIFKSVPITGHGLGTINFIHKKTFFSTANNLHLEIYHFAIELGLIGVTCIGNMVKGFFEIKAEDRLELVLKAMVLGFFVSCMFNYPAHLWLPSTYACFAYSSIYALKGDKNGKS